MRANALRPIRTSLLPKSLLICAGALMACSGAYAQSKDGAPAPERAPAAIQSAPAEIIAPPSQAVPDRGPAAQGAKPQTSGQGAASANSALTGEQRSKVSAAIKQQNAERVTNVNFSISIGTAIPPDMRRAPLPAAVSEVYPVWRGYDYILVGDEIVVIDPATLRIVAIVEA